MRHKWQGETSSDHVQKSLLDSNVEEKRGSHGLMAEEEIWLVVGTSGRGQAPIKHHRQVREARLLP